MEENKDLTPAEEPEPALETVRTDTADKRKPGIKGVFVNRFGHIRAGWRMIIYIVICLIVIIPTIMLISSFSDSDEKPDPLSWLSVLVTAVTILAMMLGALITLRWIDRRPFGLLGVNLYPGWLRELGIGVLIGFGLLFVLFLIFWVTGLIAVTTGDFTGAVLSSLGFYLLMFTLAGALEELMMRGYLFQAMIEGTRVWIALLFLSILFGLMHMNNPNATWAGGLNTGLAGVLLGVAYVKTRALWMPIGLHLAWNFTQGPLLGMNVSGITIENSLLHSTPQGNELLSGGAFGAEGSLITAVFIVGLSWYLWKAEWLTPSDENSRMWSRYPAGFGQEPPPPEE